MERFHQCHRGDQALGIYCVPCDLLHGLVWDHATQELQDPGGSNQGGGQMSAWEGAQGLPPLHNMRGEATKSTF